MSKTYNTQCVSGAKWEDIIHGDADEKWPNTRMKAELRVAGL
jgi:hypothetical protein